MKQKTTFNKNFDVALSRLLGCKISDFTKFKFALHPVDEEVGVKSSKDIWMSNAVLKTCNIDELKDYEDTIQILSAGSSNYPLWINLKRNSIYVVDVQFSLRFRHIKISHNQETGHPPFKVITH